MSLLNAQISDLCKQQRYVYIGRHYRNSYKDHQRTLQDPKGTTYAMGDIVAIKNHALSAAGYGLSLKFMARYKGPYQVTGQLSSNVYFLKDLNDPKASPITANVRQMILLQKDRSPTIESRSERRTSPKTSALLNSAPDTI